MARGRQPGGGEEYLKRLRREQVRTSNVHVPFGVPDSRLTGRQRYAKGVRRKLRWQEKIGGGREGNGHRHSKPPEGFRR